MELFARRGYERTSLSRIVARSGTSKGTLYHYFRNKDDLFVQVMERLLDELERRLGDVDITPLTRDTFWPTLSDHNRRSMEAVLESPYHMRLWRVYQQELRHRSDSEPARRLRQRNIQEADQIAALGQSLGCVRSDLSPRQCAELIEAVDSSLDEWLHAKTQKDMAQALLDHHEVVMDTIKRLMLP